MGSLMLQAQHRFEKQLLCWYEQEAMVHSQAVVDSQQVDCEQRTVKLVVSLTED
jgi:hypothetical protein